MGKCSPLSSTQVSFPSSITPGSFGLMLSSPQLFAPSNTVETSFFLVLLFPHVKAKLIVFFVSYDFLLCLCVEFSPLCTLSWSSQTFFFPVFFFPPTFFCILLAATACLYPESFRAIQMEHLLIQRVLSVVLSGKWKWGKAKQCFQHYFTTNENAQKKITKKKGVPLDDPEYILKDPHPSPFRVAGINKRYQNRATVCSGWRDLKVRHDNPWSISANPWAGMFSYSSHFSHT